MYKKLKGLLEDWKLYIKTPYPEHIAKKELESIQREVKNEVSKMLCDENEAEFAQLTEAEHKEIYKILFYEYQ